MMRYTMRQLQFDLLFLGGCVLAIASIVLMRLV